jgi:hypothetical protein
MGWNPQSQITIPLLNSPLFLFGVFPVEMDNEELGRKVRRLYNEFNKMMVKQGYGEVSLDQFLEWIEDMIDDPYN